MDRYWKLVRNRVNPMSSATRKMRCWNTCSVTTPLSCRGENTVSIIMAVMVELPKASIASTAVEHRAKMYRLRKPSICFHTHFN